MVFSYTPQKYFWCWRDKSPPPPNQKNLKVKSAGELFEDWFLRPPPHRCAKAGAVLALPGWGEWRRTGHRGKRTRRARSRGWCWRGQNPLSCFKSCFFWGVLLFGALCSSYQQQRQQLLLTTTTTTTTTTATTTTTITTTTTTTTTTTATTTPTPTPTPTATTAAATAASTTTTTAAQNHKSSLKNWPFCRMFLSRSAMSVESWTQGSRVWGAETWNKSGSDGSSQTT